MHGFSLQDVLILVTEALGLVLLLVRLITARLFSVYPAFGTYIAITLGQLSLPFLFSFHDERYAYAYILSEGLILCFYVLVVLELYTIVFRDFTGIASLARKYTKIALVIAIAVSLAPLWSGPVPKDPVTMFQLIEDPVVFSLVIFILLITAFLAYYPVPLSRNALVYSLGYSIYFLSKATLVFVQLQHGQWRGPASTALMAVSTACLFFWAIFLTEPGEIPRVIVGHGWDISDRERIMDQLKSVNASLLRTARK